MVNCDELPQPQTVADVVSHNRNRTRDSLNLRGCSSKPWWSLRLWLRQCRLSPFSGRNPCVCGPHRGGGKVGCSLHGYDLHLGQNQPLWSQACPRRAITFVVVTPDGRSLLDRNCRCGPPMKEEESTKSVMSGSVDRGRLDRSSLVRMTRSVWNGMC